MTVHHGFQEMITGGGFESGVWEGKDTDAGVRSGTPRRVLSRGVGPVSLPASRSPRSTGVFRETRVEVPLSLPRTVVDLYSRPG